MTKNKFRKESDDEFMKRISEMMVSSKKKAEKEYQELSNTKEAKEAKEEGKKWGQKIKDLERCHEILLEFEKDPPVQNSIYINDMCAYFDYDEQHKGDIEFLKKNYMSKFASARNSERYFTPTFNTFGEVFLKRGSILIPLPKSSQELPIIIKDGDIIITKDKSYVMDLVDSGEKSEDEVRLFMFPNSEARISISEKITKPEIYSMDSSIKIPDVIKKKCKSVVHTFRIKNIELIRGLFHVMIDKSQGSLSKNANNFITIPKVQFKGTGEVYSGLLEDMISKMRTQNPKMAALYEAQIAVQKTKTPKSSDVCSILNFYAELSDSTTVIFGTLNKLVINGKPIDIKSNTQPKYTITGSRIYVTDCQKNPDPRVKEIMDAAYNMTNYVAVVEGKKNFLVSPGMIGIEKANEALKLAKRIDDKLLIQVAEYKLKAAQSELGREKSYKESFSPEGLKRKRKEAEEMLAAAKESGNKELIEVAEQQIIVSDMPEEIIPPQTEQETKKQLDKMEYEFSSNTKKSFSSYNIPSGSDAV